MASTAADRLRDAVAAVGRSEPVVAVGEALGEAGAAAKRAYGAAKRAVEPYLSKSSTQPARRVRRGDIVLPNESRRRVAGRR